MSYNSYSQPPAVPPDYDGTAAPEVEIVKRQPGPTAATVCFLIVLILFNAFGLVGGRLFNLSSIWITFIGEIGIVAAVPLLFALIRRYEFKHVFSLQRINIGTLALCVLVGLAAQFAVRLPSLLSNWLLQIFGPLYVPQQLDDGTPSGKVLFIIAALVLAPLCEETLNRGFVMSGYRRLGLWRCVIIVGLFFGFFHQYPYRFLDTVSAGIILTYLALTTGSIFASMAGHFGFNLFPAIVSLFRDQINNYLRQTSNSQIADPDILIVTGEQVVASIIFSLVGSALVFLLLRSVTRRTARVRPGVVLNYSGLATEIVEGVTSYENGPYWGPDNQPYRYTPAGYRPEAAPLPHRPRPANYSPPLKKRIVTAGWVITWLLVLTLFAFTSYTELLLRGEGQRYCQQKPKACQTAIIETPPQNYLVRIFTSGF